MNGLGQKLTGKNIRSFGQKMIGNVKVLVIKLCLHYQVYDRL